MTIQDGYNSKPTHITFSDLKSDGTSEMWIRHEGMEGKNEVLIYITPTELVRLFKEVQVAGRDLFT